MELTSILNNKMRPTWVSSIEIECFLTLSFIMLKILRCLYSLKTSENLWYNGLTLSGRRPLSYRNHCGANQWTGFYMITASVMKGLMDDPVPLLSISPYSIQMRGNREMRTRITRIRTLFTQWIFPSFFHNSMLKLES